MLRRASRTTPTALTTLSGNCPHRRRPPRAPSRESTGAGATRRRHALAARRRRPIGPTALFDTARAERETLKQRRLAEAVEHVRERLGQDAISWRGTGTGANAPERGEEKGKRRKGKGDGAGNLRTVDRDPAGKGASVRRPSHRRRHNAGDAPDRRHRRAHRQMPRENGPTRRRRHAVPVRTSLHLCTGRRATHASPLPVRLVRAGFPGRHVSATDAMTPRRRATLIVA